MLSTRHIATLKTLINLASGIDATKLTHYQNEATSLCLMGIHVHGLCIYSQYQ